ncbi:hypothetical protein PybrP1_000731 [[Pythium] brassicae (nom. inval.)]|nr:hypothetical protein PybrP1_000731 [[Pythium] brassicae (nom. inval.)]
MAMAAATNARLAAEDSSYSQISCGPSSIAAKLLVGIVAVSATGGRTTYTVRAQLAGTNFEWTVQRRFSDFLQLRDDLVAFFARCMVQQCFGCRWFGQSLHGFAFPRRRLLSSRGTDVVLRRRCALEQFARLLAAHAFSAIPKCVMCSKLPFARVRDFFVKDAALPPHVGRHHHDALFFALRVENFSAIADPKKSKIEFRRGHGILRMLQIEKTVHSKRAHHEQAFRDQVRRDQQHALRHHHRPTGAGHGRGTESLGGGATAFDAEAAADSDEHASSGSESEREDEDILEDGAMTVVEIDMTRSTSARRLAPLPQQSWDAVAQSLASTMTMATA